MTPFPSLWSCSPSQSTDLIVLSYSAEIYPLSAYHVPHCFAGYSLPTLQSSLPYSISRMILLTVGLLKCFASVSHKKVFLFPSPCIWGNWGSGEPKSAEVVGDTVESEPQPLCGWRTHSALVSESSPCTVCADVPEYNLICSLHNFVCAERLSFAKWKGYWNSSRTHSFVCWRLLWCAKWGFSILQGCPLKYGSAVITEKSFLL